MHPSLYGTTVTRPPDFEEFWAAAEVELAEVPLEPAVTPEPYWTTDDVAVYTAAWNSLNGVRVHGWYCVPRTGPGPFPGMIYVPGYISDPAIPFDWAREGYASLFVAHRGKLRSNSTFNPGYPGVLTHNITDRNTYAYRGIYLDAARAVDLLLTRPEVRPDRIAVQGSSQGGALTTVISALRAPHIVAACAGAPYLTGFMDAIRLTRSYPYEEINEYLRFHPERTAQVRETLAYFDCQNFAPMVQAPILVNIGMQDDVCPPETGFPYFERLGSAVKELKVYEPAGHDAGAVAHGHNQLIRAWMRKYLLEQ